MRDLMQYDGHEVDLGSGRASIQPVVPDVGKRAGGTEGAVELGAYIVNARRSIRTKQGVGQRLYISGARERCPGEVPKDLIRPRRTQDRGRGAARERVELGVYLNLDGAIDDVPPDIGGGLKGL